MTVKIVHYDELTKDELYRILELRNEVFVVEQNCSYQDCDGKDVDAYHLLLEENGLVAYLRILKPGVYYPEYAIGRVLVKEKHRDKNYGKLIMNKGIDYIYKELGASTIRISAQSYLRKFYTSLGFEVVSDEYLEDDIPHLEMLAKRK
jgi:ElaA protein